MRRLLVLACAIVFVDTMFYSAMTPLLPRFEDEFGLSKSAAGVLVAAYPAGTLIGAMPGGYLAARAGVRATVLLGMALLVVASVAFAFADTIAVLDTARFIQGLGGAASWAGAMAWVASAAPRGRRGEMIGTTMGAAIAGDAGRAGGRHARRRGGDRADVLRRRRRRHAARRSGRCGRRRPRPRARRRRASCSPRFATAASPAASG